MKKTLLLFAAFSLLFISNFKAANRYWIATSGSNWNNTSNWSTSSGGSGGASVPITGDFVYFNINGQGNCTFDIPVAFDGITITNNYTGTIDLAGFSFNPTVSGTAVCSFRGGTISDTPGTSVVNYTTTNQTQFDGTTFNAAINIISGRVKFDGGVFNNSVTVEDNGSSSTNGDGGCIFNSTFKATNSGSSYFLMGITSPDIFNASVTLINTSSSRIRMAYSSTGNQFNGNLILGSSNGQGIYFGESGGQSTLASSKTISVDVNGYTKGELRFKNFVQLGSTSQNLVLTGTSIVRVQTGTIFNGNVNFTSSRLFLDGGNFVGTSYFEKTGSSDDYSSGGNTFTGNTELKNSSNSQLIMGNVNPDHFSANLLINNSGTRHTYLARNSIGNTVGGTLTVNNSASGTKTNVILCYYSTSSLTVTGSAIFNNIASSNNSQISIGKSGDITFNGSLTLNNSATGTQGYIFLAENSASSITVTGNTLINNAGSVHTKRTYVGNSGDIVFNGTVSFNNSSSAQKSEIYVNNFSSSNITFNDNITVSSTHSKSDGIRFGQSNGTSTLASTKTISVGGTGFIAGPLHLRNFTQLGTTSQNLNLTVKGYLYIYSSTFNGNVNFVAPRINTRNTLYNGTAYLQKSGGTDDASAGGNTFIGNTELKNSGSGYFLMGNGSSDNFNSNLTINNTGTKHIYLAYNSSGNSIAGSLTINNTASGSSGNVYMSTADISDLTVNGITSINNATSATNSNVYIGNKGDIIFNNNVNIINTPTGTNGQIIVSNDSNSTITFNGSTVVSNSGSGTTKRIYLGNQGDIVFNGLLKITNNSSASNSEIYLNHNPYSNNTYNDNIIIESTNPSSDGIRFGNSQGTGTLANTKTITVGASGFSSGNLTLRNFNQIGGTAQNITLTGTGYLYNYNSNFGGNVVFKAPRFNTRGTSYNGTSHLEKTGGIGDDYSTGGNIFSNNITIVNSGSRTLIFGNGVLDNFLANVDLINSGTSSLYFARSGAGHSISGNLNITNSATGSGAGYIVTGYQSSSTLSVGGNVSLLSNGSANEVRTYFADNGNTTVQGNLSIVNSGSGAHSVTIAARQTASALTMNGTTNVINNGNASIRNRIILGHDGDIIFNGTLNIENYAGSVESEVFCNRQSTSSNQYNDHITISSKHVSCDGVLFGDGGGSGTLATTKTITIPGTDITNFIGGTLKFRNFTQLGNTAHSFELASTASYIYNYNSNWGGDISFVSPRTFTRGTTFNGTVYLEKTGSTNDYNYGSNNFVGNTEIKLSNNVGTGKLQLSNNAASSFGGNLILKNSGAFSDLGLGTASGTYNIGGDLTLINESTGTGSQHIFLSNNASAIFNITGNATINNSSSGTSGTHNIYLSNNGAVNISGNITATNSGIGGVSKNTYIGNAGDITIGGFLNMTNTSTASTAQYLIGNSSSSTVTIGGNTSLINNGSGSNKQCYFGNYGDITFNGDLDITNNASASYSEIYLNYRTNSFNQYNGDITIKSLQTSCDGYRFGSGGGSSTLAATKTISIPGVDATNFIGGSITLQNFTQTGSTSQSLELGATAIYIISKNSNWGGNINFKAPRIVTNGTNYSETTYLEKTGANSDQSIGGNTFVGNTEIKNTGSGYFLMGNGTADDFQSDLILNNNSTHNLYLAYNSIGNNIGGNLTVNHNTTGSNNAYTYLANTTASSLTVSGLTTINNNASSNVGYIVLGDNGDVTLNGGLNANNSGSTINGHILIANNTNSQVTVNGLSSIINSSAGTYKRIYLGNHGDLIFNNDLNISNNSNATNSEILLNYNSNSSNQYNGNISIASTHASSDGIRFGQNGGSGILANSKTISVSGSGFIAGQLAFRNFTQTGSTSQNLILTGSGYLNLRNSQWNGEIDFRSPRVFTRQTTYNNTTSLEKTGGANDASTGGNQFNDNAILKNSGTGYFMPSNGQANDFNGNVTYIRTGSGIIYPSYNNASTYAKNITVNSSNTVIFGASSNGRVIFDGGSAQSINVIGATPSPVFRDIQTSNNSGDITLNTPVTISKELDLDNGNLITTSTNVIYMNDNTSVSSVSNSAFVDGPLVKIGNDAFTFPVGNDGFYAPISMSSPSSSSSRFEAKYLHTPPQTDGYDTTAISSGLDHISSTEYWTLNRLVGSNNVKATIGWGSTRSENISTGTRCNIRVARWNGTKWLNEGNGGITGSAAIGTIITGTSEDCATSTKITSWINDYPITLAIDSNYITWDGTAYDGGSGSGNAPDNSDAGRVLKVYAPNAVISSDATLSQIIVTAAGELTINNGVAVSVSDKINNNGYIQVENNASILQTNVGSNENSGSGTYKVKREGNNFANSYNIWSSPIQNASLVSTFPGTNPCDIWLFDHINQTWNHDYAIGFSTTCYGNSVTFTATDVIAGGDGIMDAARGYFVPGAAASTREYDGKINNGNITKSVVTTSLGNNPNWDQDDWNLLGNPYPSALNAAAFWNENAVNNTRITDAVYFWDGGDTTSGYNQHSDYASWNSLGGVNSGNSGTIPSGHIASGQGFWVYASSSSNVVFNNSMRSGTNSQYFKTEAQNDNHLAWISVSSPQNYQNNILIGYNDITTDSIDQGYDAHKFVGSSHIRFASMIGNEEFSIQGIEALNVGDSRIIPLALFTADSGNHIFNNYKTQNLPNNIKVYIRDLDNGTTQDLSQGDYTVSLPGNIEYLNRFELVFKNEISLANGGKGDKGNPNTGDTTVTDINQLHTNDLFHLQKYSTGYTLSHPNGINGDIQIMDVTGKVVWTQTNINGNSSVFINLNNMSTGIYFLNVVNNNNRLYYSKIIKN
jgi:hypothetical protein